MMVAIAIIEKSLSSLLIELLHLMEGERLVKKIYQAEVEGNTRRGRPRRRWMDGVKGCLSERGLSIPEAKECVKDRREWRRIVGGAT